MATKVLSIEIGQQITRICEVDYKKKKPKVYHCSAFNTPQGVIDDGYIRDKIAFATALKEQLTLANIKNDNVIFTVSSTKIANREAIIPLVKDHVISSVVRANVGDYFPVNVEEFNITHTVLEKINTKEEKQLKLLVLAAPASLIKSYYELAEILKFNIVAIDYVGNSSFQLLRNQVNMGVNLVVQMNEQSTIVNLMENDKLLIQRTLLFGTNEIVSAVMGNPVFGVDNYLDAVRILKHDQLINPQFQSEGSGFEAFAQASDEFNQKLLRDRAKEDITDSLHMLLSNINRVVDYFNTKFPGKKIGGVHLAGDGTQIRGLQELLRNEMGIEVHSLVKLFNVSFVNISPAVYDTQGNFIACIGAAIQPIDFTPSDYVSTRSVNGGSRFPAIVLTLCLVGAIGIFATSYLAFRMAEGERNELQLEIDSIADIEEIYKTYMNSKSDAANMLALHGATQEASEKFLVFLEELEQKTPKGSMVSTLTLQDSELTIQIKSNSKTICAKYIETLKTFESLSSVTTSGYTETLDEANVPEVTYVVACTFR